MLVVTLLLRNGLLQRWLLGWQVLLDILLLGVVVVVVMMSLLCGLVSL